MDGRTGGFLRDFFSGAALVGRGLRMWSTSPRLMLLGMLPALIVGVAYLAGIVILAMNLATIAARLTSFAGEWDEPLRSGVRVAAALAVAGVAAFLLLATYTAVTLAVGDPFYEKIWRNVEEQLGGIPDEIEVPFWSSVRRSVVDALRILLLTAAVGLVLFAGGFVPVIGQTLVPVLAVAAGGWVLALELSGFAFQARGFTPGDRRRVLRGRRAAALGFGMTTYLLFLLPLGAVLVMPAAVAGATLLARQALGARDRGASATS